MRDFLDIDYQRNGTAEGGAVFFGSLGIHQLRG